MSHTGTAGLPEPQASPRAYKEGKGEGSGTIRGVASTISKLAVGTRTAFIDCDSNHCHTAEQLFTAEGDPRD